MSGSSENSFLILILIVRREGTGPHERLSGKKLLSRPALSWLTCRPVVFVLVPDLSRGTSGTSRLIAVAGGFLGVRSGIPASPPYVVRHSFGVVGRSGP